MSFLFGLEDLDMFTSSREMERQEKSLLNTFPFNQEQDTDHHHHQLHHAAEHAKVPHNSLFPFKAAVDSDTMETVETDEDTTDRVTDTVTIDDFQEDQLEVGSVDFNTVGATSQAEEDVAAGRKCIDKVMMVEETEYDEVVTCDHSYDRRCHTSYVTSYVSTQQEECDENFRKVCYIDYEPQAFNETVEVCRTPVMKDCREDVGGEQLCRTVYETECWTKHRVHEVEDEVAVCETQEEEDCRDVVSGYTSTVQCTKYPVEKCRLEKKMTKKVTPETGCDKEPVELCAPRGCGFINGPVVCNDRVKTVVVERPVEECALEPIKSCDQVTKLVPKLVPVEDCVEVPKEICARSKTNPHKVKRPVIKKWCYVPSKESGLV